MSLLVVLLVLIWYEGEITMVNTQDFLDDTKADIQTFILTRSTYLAIGSGTTTPTTTDTTLDVEELRKARQEYTQGVSDVVVSLFVGSTEGNGTSYTEVGVFDAASSGNLMMRQTYPSIAKTTAIDIWVDVEEQIDVTQ